MCKNYARSDDVKFTSPHIIDSNIINQFNLDCSVVGTKPRCVAYSISLPLVKTVYSFSTADRTISQRT